VRDSFTILIVSILSVSIGFAFGGAWEVNQQRSSVKKVFPITILFPTKDAAEVEWQSCIINLNTRKRTSYIYCPEKDNVNVVPGKS